MTSASALRIQIEHALERRFPSALTPVPRTIRETAATGIAAVDTLLGGGLPVGAISEVVGQQSSGRTSLARSFLAHRTQDGQVAAWVDAADAFDPESAAANGVSLRQLLWIRCHAGSTAIKNKTWTRLDQAIRTRLDQAIRATDLLLQSGGFAAIVLDMRVGFRWPRGSASARRQTARAAAWWCWGSRRMRNRARPWWWNARHGRRRRRERRC